MSRVTLDPASFVPVSHTRLSRSVDGLSSTILLPAVLPYAVRTPFWALPRSLAATCGIVITFSSSGYLDVSVHRVPSVWLWIYHTVTGCASRVPPFRHLRINAYVQLPAAFRSLSRLSSALSAKASALRPLLLNHCSRISLLIRLVLFYPAWRFILDESNFVLSNIACF